MPVISSTLTVWRPVVLLQRRRLEVGVADRLDLLLKLHRILLGGVEPIPALVGLQGGLAEVTAHLGHRDRRHDAALDDLIGQFVGRPVSDGPAGLLRGLAGDGQDLGDLLRSELAGGAGPGLIAEDLLDGPAQGGMAFEALDANEPVPGVGPASPPEADLPPRQSDLGGDLGIALAVEGQEDDGGPLPELGRRRGGVLNGTEDILLTFGDGHLGGFTRHAENLPGGCESSESR